MFHFDVLDHLLKLAFETGIWDLNDYRNFSLVFPYQSIPKQLFPLVLEYYSSTGNLEKFLKFKDKIDISQDRTDLIEIVLKNSQINLLNQYYKYWDLKFGNYSCFLTAIKFGQLKIIQISKECTAEMVFHSIIYNQLKILEYFLPSVFFASDQLAEHDLAEYLITLK